MARSFGLKAYRALARRGDDAAPDLSIPRPQGELLWLHLGAADNRLAVTDLARRISQLREGANVLLTLPPDCPPEGISAMPGDGVLIERTIPAENPIHVDMFLKHWAPDVCVWTWGRLRPNLVMATAETRAKMFLVDADSSGFDGRRDRWLPELARMLLATFSSIVTRSPAARNRMLQLGVAKDRLRQSKPLQPIGHALPADDDDVSALAETIVGRAVWFANGVTPNELNTILSAHRIALRRSHRLLLIIRTAPDLDPSDVIQQARQSEFRIADWDNGDYPDEATQILVAQDPKDVGLFYRIAPVSMMGGTLRPSAQSVDPFQAAALGSVVLYGPKVGPFLASYTQLAKAGAARIVNDSQALGNAVAQLIRPEQAALMAHAGWNVITDGAAVTDHISQMVMKALDGDSS